MLFAIVKSHKMKFLNPFGYGGNTLTSAAKWISINSEFLHNHTSSQNAESGLIQATKQNPQHYKSKIRKSAEKKHPCLLNQRQIAAQRFPWSDYQFCLCHPVQDLPDIFELKYRALCRFILFYICV